MSETKINQNQIAGGGGGGKIKILNVAQTGTLTRNGAVYSGFSSSDYLQIGNVYNNGYFEFNNAVKDFGAMTETADTWEMVWNFKHKSTDAGIIFACNVSEGNQLVVGDELELCLSNENGNWSIGEVVGTTTLTIDTLYWVKVEFTGTAYIMSLSTDGINYTTEATITSNEKLTNRAVYTIGKNVAGYPLGEDLYVSGCYIKANGEYWWKGIEEIVAGGDGDEIKIFNVVETGTLEMNGGKFSGFDGDNYLSPARMSPQGYYNPNIKEFDFGAIKDSAWEAGIVFNSSDLSKESSLFVQSQEWATDLQVFVFENKLHILLGESGEAIGTTTIQENTDYYLKIVFTGSAYQLYLSTTSFDNAILEATLTTSDKPNSSIIYLGCRPVKIGGDELVYLTGYIDIPKCYIKSGNDIVWKGLETL